MRRRARALCPRRPYRAPIERRRSRSPAPGVDPPSGERAGTIAPLPRYGAPRTVPAREPRRRCAPIRAPRQAPFSSPTGRRPVGADVAVARRADTGSRPPRRCRRRRRSPVRSSRRSTTGSPRRCSPRRMQWFGQPVTEIKQISAYSCRGMNGNPNAHISEHAFGNALDIASFVLADGHDVTVEKGWRGAPRSRGSCATFRPPPASCSPPCWRPAPTSTTTTTSTWI